MAARIRRALVTGASAGIGAAMSRELAARDVEVVLVARRSERLDEVSEQLPAPAEVLVADLAEQAGRDRVAARLTSTDQPVDLLVNNAGLGVYGALSSQDPDRIRAVLDVNVTALVELTRAALPGLLAREAGGIINVGSTAGYLPGPYSAVYGATKAFVRSFTEAIHEELRATPVHVLLLAPGVTSTEFQEVAGVPEGAFPPALTGTADEVARAGLEAFAARRPVCVPAVADRVVAYGAQVVPSALTRRLRATVMRRFVA